MERSWLRDENECNQHHRAIEEPMEMMEVFEGIGRGIEEESLEPGHARITPGVRRSRICQQQRRGSANDVASAYQYGEFARDASLIINSTETRTFRRLKGRRCQPSSARKTVPTWLGA